MKAFAEEYSVRKIEISIRIQGYLEIIKTALFEKIIRSTKMKNGKFVSYKENFLDIDDFYGIVAVKCHVNPLELH